MRRWLFALALAALALPCESKKRSISVEDEEYDTKPRPFELRWEAGLAVAQANADGKMGRGSESRTQGQIEVGKYFQAAGPFHMGPKFMAMMGFRGPGQDYDQFGFFAMTQTLIPVIPKAMNPYSRNLLIGGGLGYLSQTLAYDDPIFGQFISIRPWQSWTAMALRVEAHYRYFNAGLTYVFPGPLGETSLSLSVGVGIY